MTTAEALGVGARGGVAGEDRALGHASSDHQAIGERASTLRVTEPWTCSFWPPLPRAAPVDMPLSVHIISFMLTPLAGAGCGANFTSAAGPALLVSY